MILARVSALYDVLNNIVIQGTLSPIKNGEISLAHRHIKEVVQNDLLYWIEGIPVLN